MSTVFTYAVILTRSPNIFSLVLNCCLYSCCLNMNLMTFNFCGGILYFVDVSCFDTDLKKMLSGEMCFAVLF